MIYPEWRNSMKIWLVWRQLLCDVCYHLYVWKLDSTQTSNHLNFRTVNITSYLQSVLEIVFFSVDMSNWKIYIHWGIWRGELLQIICWNVANYRFFKVIPIRHDFARNCGLKTNFILLFQVMCEQCYQRHSKMFTTTVPHDSDCLCRTNEEEKTYGSSHSQGSGGSKKAQNWETNSKTTKEQSTNETHRREWTAEGIT